MPCLIATWYPFEAATALPESAPPMSPPITPPLAPPATARPMSAPAAAPPATAPRFRARVEPAMMESVLAATIMSLPSTLTEESPSSSNARSPFFAGRAARTVPVTTLPAGITTRSPTITFSLTVPVQVSPACADSEVMGLVTSILTGVPAATMTAGASCGACAWDDLAWACVREVGLGLRAFGASTGGGASALGGSW